LLTSPIESGNVSFSGSVQPVLSTMPPTLPPLAHFSPEAFLTSRARRPRNGRRVTLKLLGASSRRLCPCIPLLQMQSDFARLGSELVSHLRRQHHRWGSPRLRCGTSSAPTTSLCPTHRTTLDASVRFSAFVQASCSASSPRHRP